MSKKIEEIITKEVCLDALRLARDSMNELDKGMKEITKKTLHENLGTKMVSELMSKCLEVSLATVLEENEYNVRSANATNEPDIKILLEDDSEEDCELKLTHSDRNWIGGEYSNRPSPHIFASWGGDFNEFFVLLIDLDAEGVEWQSNMQKGRKFYGPFITAKQLKGKGKLLMGNFRVGPRGGVTVKRDNID